jgi:hypothetical protein
MVPAPSGGPGRVRPRPAGCRFALFAALLAAGLGGLAFAAVGIAHQLLPRQFTPAQQSRIATWEMERRWRALPAGKIFPGTVAYQLPGAALNASSSLALDARRLGVAEPSACPAAVTGGAAAVLRQFGCSEALRATYLDASGSMVTTVEVAVLPDAAAAKTAAADLTSQSGGSALLVRTYRVAGTPAAGFGDAERQMTRAVAAGPYVVLATAGFADGRRRIDVAGDYYLTQEITSLIKGVAGSAAASLGSQPSVPQCPGAPGC